LSVHAAATQSQLDATNAGEQLLAEQRDEGLRNTLTAALIKFMSANSHSLYRNNKKVFRDFLGAFAVDAQSKIRVR